MKLQMKRLRRDVVQRYLCLKLLQSDHCYQVVHLEPPKSNGKRKQQKRVTSTDEILVQQAPHRVSELLNDALREAEELFPDNTKRPRVKEKRRKKTAILRLTGIAWDIENTIAVTGKVCEIIFYLLNSNIHDYTYSTYMYIFLLTYLTSCCRHFHLCRLQLCQWR